MAYQLFHAQLVLVPTLGQGGLSPTTLKQTKGQRNEEVAEAKCLERKTLLRSKLEGQWLVLTDLSLCLLAMRLETLCVRVAYFSFIFK